MPTRRQVELRALAAREAQLYGGVLSRRILRSLGADRHVVAAEVDQERWGRHGTQTIAVHTGPLDQLALHWRAIWETGVGIAALDGASALHAAGMTGFATGVVQVSIPHGLSCRAVDGVHSWWVVRRDDELVGAGIPRVQPAVAAIRAAHHAVSDRQAALLLVLPVQQRFVTGAQLQAALEAVPGRGRTAFVRGTVRAITDGAQALAELDFGRLCVLGDPARRHRPADRRHRAAPGDGRVHGPGVRRLPSPGRDRSPDRCMTAGYGRRKSLPAIPR